MYLQNIFIPDDGTGVLKILSDTQAVFIIDTSVD